MTQDLLARYLQRVGGQALRTSTMFGETETVFAPPYDSTALPVVMQALDALQSLRSIDDSAHQALLADHGLWANGWIVPDAAEVVGRALFDALGQDGRSILRGALNHGMFERHPLTFVLRFPQRAVELAALPWELLHDNVDFVLFLHLRAVGTAATEQLKYAREQGVKQVVVLSATNVDDPLDEQPSHFRGDRNKEVEAAAVRSQGRFGN